MVTLHPTPNYLVSLPIKLFEYMAAGLPSIVSNFPYWQELVGEADCALFVDPLSPQEIAQAAQQLLTNPDRAQAMGLRGRELVIQRYSWEKQAQRLISFYQAFEEGNA